jgi:hypothetical protein
MMSPGFVSFLGNPLQEKPHMRRQGNILPRLAALACFCLPLSAMADAGEIRAGFDCQPGRDRLILTYDAAYGYAWEKMAEKASATQWDPRMLVTYNDDGFIGDVRSEHGVCRLSDGEYRIKIMPNPGNANVQGVCGAWMGAGAKVEKDGKTLFDGNFDNSCHLPDEPVISRVLIRPGKKPLKRQIAAGENLQLIFTTACHPEFQQLRLGFAFDVVRFARAPGVNVVEDLLAHMDKIPRRTLRGTRFKDLMEYADQGSYEASCRLEHDEYRYVLRPGISTGKSCGAAKWVSAHLYITKNGQIIYDAPFMGDCGDPEALVLRSVTVHSGREPEAETLPAALFYDPDGDPDNSVYRPAESRE